MDNKNSVEATEEILYVNIIEEDGANADMLCNSLGCA